MPKIHMEPCKSLCCHWSNAHNQSVVVRKGVHGDNLECKHSANGVPENLPSATAQPRPQETAFMEGSAYNRICKRPGPIGRSRAPPAFGLARAPGSTIAWANPAVRGAGEPTAIGAPSTILYITAPPPSRESKQHGSLRQPP